VRSRTTVASPALCVLAAAIRARAPTGAAAIAVQLVNAAAAGA